MIRKPLTPYPLLLTLLLSGCAAAENFFAHDRKLAVDGFYTVTQYGMLGVGRVKYESKQPAAEERLKKLEEQLDTLQKIILALVARLSEPPEARSPKPETRLGF